MNDSNGGTWCLPYVDQPPSFWDELRERFGDSIREVYFPPLNDVIGTGRPKLPDGFITSFLRDAALPKAVLLNAVVLPGPLEVTSKPIIEEVRRLRDDFGVQSATVANLRLAEEVRKAIPEMTLTASVLMDITQPSQVLALNGLFDVLVPGSGAMRNRAALSTLKRAFDGRIRLLVNEGCLGGCPYRPQHFYEMASNQQEPLSLCDGLLEREPWLRLTGAWVVPQFLKFYDGIFDELKLAGRATLRERDRYLDVVDSYVHRRPMLPCDIGGGPASVIEPIEMPEELFAYTLECGQQCHICRRCEDHYHKAMAELESGSSWESLES